LSKMPSSNGVYSLPPGFLAVTGGTIVVSQHNPIFEDVAAALTLRLSRDGTASMTGPLQLASGTVSNPGAVFATDPMTGLYSLGAGLGIGVAVGGVQVASFLPGGITGARVVGELVPFTGTAAPSALWLLPFGQTVSRMTFAALWAFAQVEIANGSTLYNNGDGSTTFGILDLRGSLPIAWDVMGGTASGRLTLAASGVDGTKLGPAGGSQTYTLLQSDLPNVAPGITDPGHAHNFTAVISQFESAVAASGGLIGAAGPAVSTTTTNVTGITVHSINGGVTQTATKNLPPVVVTNYLLFAGAAA
jgi:microcystin-dependent protein